MAFLSGMGVGYRSKFNPVTDVPWDNVYSPMGGRYKASAFADGGSITTLPDEANLLNAPNGSGTNRTAWAPAFNRPAMDFLGSGDGKNSGTSPLNIPVPFTAILIAILDAPGVGHYITDGSDQPGNVANRMLFRASSFTDSQISFNNGAQLNGPGNSTGMKVMRALASSNGAFTVNETMVFGSSGTQNFQGMCVGGVGGAPFDGQIMLIGIVRGDLSTYPIFRWFADWAFKNFGQLLR